MSPDFVNRIHQGDCIAGLNGLPAGSVDLCFADPPFNIGYEYDVYHDRREHEHYLDWSRQWIGAVHRVLKPDGTFWLAIGDDYAAELKLASQQLGFHCRSWVVWYYTFGVNCKNKFTRSHTHLFYFVKDRQAFTFRADEAINRIPSARQLVYNDTRANPHGRLPDDTWILRPQDLADCFTADEDTWYFPRVAGTFKERAGFHGCQMPEQLLGRIIRLCSHDDDVVLDPFSGSATTLVTAKKLGRRFVGFELSEDYAKRGGERVAEAQVGAPLVGSADPTRSAPATPGRNGKRREGEAPAEPTVGPVPVAVEVQGLTGNDTAARHEPRPPGGHHAPLIDAFRGACGGYSLDRVMTDPQFQGVLARQCAALNVPGDLKSWNLDLLRLRKAGKLSSVPTTERTELAWEACEPYLLAAEAAAALLLGRDADETLDHLLCDPERAAEFDRLAARYGGKKTPFEYRWTALKLRKEARVIRRRAAELRGAELRFTVPIALARGGKLKSLPTDAGLFALYDGDGERLYVGTATNLRATLERLLPKSKWKLFDRTGDVRVAVCPLDASWSDLLAYRHAVTARSATTLNWQLPGDDDGSRATGSARAESLKPRAEPVAHLAPAQRRRRRAVAETAHG